MFYYHRQSRLSIGLSSLILVVNLFTFNCNLTDSSAKTESQTQNTNKNSDMRQTSEQKNNISGDIQALSQQIPLPVQPQEVIWQQRKLGAENSTIPGPSDYQIVAVLRYNEADAKKLVEKAKDNSGDIPAEGSIEVEPWFPEAVKKLAQKDEEDNVVTGARYNPESFMRSPYSNGKLIRVGKTNYFILKLFSF